MENQLVVLPQELAQIAENVSLEKRNEVQVVLNHVFSGVSRMRKQLDAVNVADENDTLNMKLANTIRLGVRQVRLDAEKIFDTKRTEVQQQMLGYKTEDSLWLKAKQTMQILSKELEESARWKEETKERAETQRIEILKAERLLKIQEFEGFILPPLYIEKVTEEEFSQLLQLGAMKKKEKEDADAKAEKERIEKELAEKAEQERIKKENADLKAQQEAKEKELAEEKAKAEKEKKAMEAKLAEEKKLADEKLKAQQEATRKAEAQLKAQRDAEEAKKKAEDERLAKEKIEAEKARKAPRNQKVLAWIDSLVMTAPEGLESDETVKEILLKFNSFKNWAKTQVK